MTPCKLQGTFQAVKHETCMVSRWDKHGEPMARSRPHPLSFAENQLSGHMMPLTTRRLVYCTRSICQSRTALHLSFFFFGLLPSLFTGDPPYKSCFCNWSDPRLPCSGSWSSRGRMYGACCSCCSSASSSPSPWPPQASPPPSSPILVLDLSSFSLDWYIDIELTKYLITVIWIWIICAHCHVKCPCRSWCTTHTVFLRIPAADLSLCTNRPASTAEAASKHGCLGVNSGNCWSAATHSSYCFEYSCSADCLVLVPSTGVHWCTGQLSWWVQAPHRHTESKEVLLTTTDNRLKTICCSCEGIPILLHHQCNFVGLLDCCMGHHTHLVRTGHKVFFLAVCRGRDMCGRACPCAPFGCRINRGAR